MDFHSLKRKELQSLCKQHNIRANSTNLQMADNLAQLFKEKENQVIEVSTETESSNVVVSKEIKKVRFSPENEVIEFTRSHKMRRSRRSMVLCRKSIENVSCVEELGSESVDRTRLRGKAVVENVDNVRNEGRKKVIVNVEEKRGKLLKENVGAGRKRGRPRVVVDRSENQESVGEIEDRVIGMRLRGKVLTENVDNVSKRGRKKIVDDNIMNQDGVGNDENGVGTRRSLRAIDMEAKNDEKGKEEALVKPHNMVRGLKRRVSTVASSKTVVEGTKVGAHEGETVVEDKESEKVELRRSRRKSVLPSRELRNLEVEARNEQVLEPVGIGRASRRKNMDPNSVSSMIETKEQFVKPRVIVQKNTRRSKRQASDSIEVSDEFVGDDITQHKNVTRKKKKVNVSKEVAVIDDSIHSTQLIIGASDVKKPSSTMKESMFSEGSLQDDVTEHGEPLEAQLFVSEVTSGCKQKLLGESTETMNLNRENKDNSTVNSNVLTDMGENEPSRMKNLHCEEEFAEVVVHKTHLTVEADVHVLSEEIIIVSDNDDAAAQMTSQAEISTFHANCEKLTENSNVSENEVSPQNSLLADALTFGDQTDLKIDLEVIEAEAEEGIGPKTDLLDIVSEHQGVCSQENPGPVEPALIAPSPCLGTDTELTGNITPMRQSETENSETEYNLNDVNCLKESICQVHSNEDSAELAGAPKSGGGYNTSFDKWESDEKVGVAKISGEKLAASNISGDTMSMGKKIMDVDHEATKQVEEEICFPEMVAEMVVQKAHLTVESDVHVLNEENIIVADNGVVAAQMTSQTEVSTLHTNCEEVTENSTVCENEVSQNSLLADAFTSADQQVFKIDLEGTEAKVEEIIGPKEHLLGFVSEHQGVCAQQNPGPVEPAFTSPGPCLGTDTEITCNLTPMRWSETENSKTEYNLNDFNCLKESKSQLHSNEDSAEITGAPKNFGGYDTLFDKWESDYISEEKLAVSDISGDNMSMEKTIMDGEQETTKQAEEFFYDYTYDPEVSDEYCGGDSIERRNESIEDVAVDGSVNNAQSVIEVSDVRKRISTIEESNFVEGLVHDGVIEHMESLATQVAVPEVTSGCKQKSLNKSAGAEKLKEIQDDFTAAIITLADMDENEPSRMKEVNCEKDFAEMYVEKAQLSLEADVHVSNEENTIVADTDDVAAQITSQTEISTSHANRIEFTQNSNVVSAGHSLLADTSTFGDQTDVKSNLEVLEAEAEECAGTNSDLLDFVSEDNKGVSAPENTGPVVPVFIKDVSLLLGCGHVTGMDLLVAPSPCHGMDTEQTHSVTPIQRSTTENIQIEYDPNDVNCLKESNISPDLSNGNHTSFDQCLSNDKDGAAEISGEKLSVSNISGEVSKKKTIMGGEHEATKQAEEISDAYTYEPETDGLLFTTPNKVEACKVNEICVSENKLDEVCLEDLFCTEQKASHGKAGESYFEVFTTECISGNHESGVQLLFASPSNVEFPSEANKTHGSERQNALEECTMQKVVKQNSSHEEVGVAGPELTNNLSPEAPETEVLVETDSRVNCGKELGYSSAISVTATVGDNLNRSREKEESADERIVDVDLCIDDANEKLEITSSSEGKLHYALVTEIPDQDLLDCNLTTNVCGKLSEEELGQSGPENKLLLLFSTPNKSESSSKANETCGSETKLPESCMEKDTATVQKASCVKVVDALSEQEELNADCNGQQDELGLQLLFATPCNSEPFCASECKLEESCMEKVAPDYESMKDEDLSLVNDLEVTNVDSSTVLPVAFEASEENWNEETYEQKKGTSSLSVDHVLSSGNKCLNEKSKDDAEIISTMESPVINRDESSCNEKLRDIDSSTNIKLARSSGLRSGFASGGTIQKCSNDPGKNHCFAVCSQESNIKRATSIDAFLEPSSLELANDEGGIDVVTYKETATTFLAEEPLFSNLEMQLLSGDNDYVSSNSSHKKEGKDILGSPTDEMVDKLSVSELHSEIEMDSSDVRDILKESDVMETIQEYTNNESSNSFDIDCSGVTLPIKASTEASKIGYSADEPREDSILDEVSALGRVSSAKKTARTILIHGTPNKALVLADMKENDPLKKKPLVEDITIPRPAKRRALQDI